VAQCSLQLKAFAHPFQKWRIADFVNNFLDQNYQEDKKISSGSLKSNV
jgi:hypothetical protein